MQESFLEKNLKEIEKYDAELAEQIRNHEIKESFEFASTKCGDVNLVRNGVPLHDTIDALDEASQMWNKTSCKEENVVYYLFGLGLSYPLSKFAKNAKGKIIVYEPNFDILRITLEVVDLQDILKQENILLVQDKFKIKTATEKVYRKDDEIILSFLSSYRQLFPAELSEFMDELGMLRSLFTTGYSEIAKQSYRWAENSLKNLPNILKNEELEALRGKFKNKPAVIVSAGPSLNKVIEDIKENREKIIVICVNVALKTLLKNGITPDFVCVVEAGGCPPSIEGVDTSKLNFIMTPEVNPKMYDKEYKRVFNYYSENLLTSDWIQTFTRIDCTKYMNRGTVSILALWSAYTMGCNPIILTGQDLAFSGGQCYAKDSTFDLRYYKDEKTGKFKVKPANLKEYIETAKKYSDSDDKEAVERSVIETLEKRSNQVVTIKGQNGEMLPTSSGYALFIKHFEELIPFIKDTKLFNASTGGAQINGYENKILKEILAQYANEDINIEEKTSKLLDEYLKPNTNDSIIEEYTKNIQDLKECIKIGENPLSLMKKVNNQYRRTKQISNDSISLINKAHKEYVKVLKTCFSKNRLIMSFLYNEHVFIEDAVQKLENKEGKPDEKLAKLAEHYQRFFNLTNTTLKISTKELEKQRKKYL